LEGDEKRGNFAHWNFSKFLIEFELKIEEALGFEIL
jgi:glutathione peroxidase-family protein